MKIATFFDDNLPDMAHSVAQGKCGFSLYRGVLVQWDEDKDGRVLALIDDLPPPVLSRLLVVQEHKAAVSFLWSDIVPAGYEEGDDLEVEGDVWAIVSSLQVWSEPIEIRRNIPDFV